VCLAKKFIKPKRLSLKCLKIVYHLCPLILLTAKKGENDYGQVRLLTENQIKLALLEKIETLNDGDQLSLAMFYLSERHIIDAMLRALARALILKIILDANKDAFGHSKSGIPNREVAEELLRKISR